MSQTTPETLNRFKCEHRRAGRRTIAIRYTALMGILIGMDEAGYGPHLGPLVIAATAWHVPDEPTNGECNPYDNGEVASATVKKRRKASSESSASTRTDSTTAVLNPPSARSSSAAAEHPKSQAPDLYRLLRNVVCKKSSQRRIAIADSKVLYSPGAGLRQLERGLHSVLLSMRQNISCWSTIVRYAQADPDGHHPRTCWPTGFNCSLPVDATSEEIIRLEARFTRACDGAGIRPLLIRARLVFPAQFNDLIAYYGNKASALSHVTVGLLREVVDAAVSHSPAPSPQPPIFAVCDKHGGRNFYTAFLQHHFSEHWIAPLFESHAESHYEWGEAGSHTRVVFKVNGERFFPTALASMTAKYLRELSMRAFNEYWRSHLPELKPTAGYYRDGWRFKKEITAKQQELGIDDHLLWRNR
jgi:hypothetical protein